MPDELYRVTGEDLQAIFDEDFFKTFKRRLSYSSYIADYILPMSETIKKIVLLYFHHRFSVDETIDRIEYHFNNGDLDDPKSLLKALQSNLGQNKLVEAC